MRTATSDFVGQALSVLCMVHCALTPLVLALAPAAAGAFGTVHPILFVLVLAVALWSFFHGYRHHRQSAPLLFALGGLTLLSIGAFAVVSRLPLEIAFTVAGAGLMLVAHLKNRAAHRHCHACEA